MARALTVCECFVQQYGSKHIIEQNQVNQQTTFSTVGLKEPLVSVLTQKNITEPTPIQAQTIAPVLQCDDVIGIAKTGTGKTLAFVLPLIQQLFETGATNTATALILAPTRELAYQIQESCLWFEQSTKMRSTVIVGGMPQGKQIAALKTRPQIVIATPGRLIDLLQQKKIGLSHAQYVVLDEADQMFDMGFAPQIKEVLKHTPPLQDRQMLLFSATMPSTILELIRNQMHQPVHIELAPSGSTADNIHQEIVIIDNEHQKDALLHVMKRIDGQMLIFTRTKHKAKQLTVWLRKEKFQAEELHGNRSLPQRKKAIAAIKSKQARVLVATDIAARGIDIPNLDAVINFDLPDQAEDYVHRIGRTGRAGEGGYAISFVRSDQADELNSIQKLINTEITPVSIPGIPEAVLAPSTGKPKKGRGGRSSGGSRGGYRGGNSGGRSGGGSARGGGNRSRTDGGRGRSSGRGGIS